MVAAAKPDVFNHNFEKVASNYLTVRPGARYFHSIRLLAKDQGIRSVDLHQVRHHGGAGRGAERNPAVDGRSHIGRCRLHYDRPIPPADKHHPVKKFVTPEEFRSYETIAYTKGFPMSFRASKYCVDAERLSSTVTEWTR